MPNARAPKTTLIRIHVPDDILAKVDELAILMQRPRSYVITEALRDFVAAELEDTRVTAQEVADIEANPVAGVPHEDVLEWLIAHGSLTHEAVDEARARRVP